MRGALTGAVTALVVHAVVAAAVLAVGGGADALGQRLLVAFAATQLMGGVVGGRVARMRDGLPPAAAVLAGAGGALVPWAVGVLVASDRTGIGTGAGIALVATVAGAGLAVWRARYVRVSRRRAGARQ